MTKLPRLLGANLETKEQYHPIKLSITENMTPLSVATIELPKGEFLPARGFVELYTPYGSAGVYRVRSPRDAYGDETTTAELEHAITELGDYLVKAEYNEMMSAKTAAETIFSHYKGKSWQLGKHSALGTTKVAVSAKYISVLDALLAILDQRSECMMTFDFSTKPWSVNIVNKDTTVNAEGRLSRNVSSATVTYDDSQLCTRLYYQTWKNNKGTWTYKDSDTKKVYGIVENQLATSSDMTSAEINNAVDTYLRQHKDPRVTITIDAAELSQITGETFDKFSIGKLFRLTIPEDSLNIANNITQIVWNDVFGDPLSMTVVLGDQEDTVVSYLHEVSSGGGGSSGSSPTEKKWKEYETYMHSTDYQISEYAKRVDKNGTILEKAGLSINSKGVLIYAQDNKNQIGSKIKVESDRISLVVSGTGKNAKVKAAAIVASINEEGSQIKISADHIVLDGLVTAAQLNTQKGRIDNLIAGNTQAIKLWAKEFLSTGFSVSTTGRMTYLSHEIISLNATNRNGQNIAVLGWYQ